METDQKIAVCLLTRFFNKYWIDFLNSFINHDVYIVIDDNTVIYDKLYGKVNIIQINDDICRSANFYKSSTWANLKDIVAWDRGLYYFSKVNNNYDHVWFIEDDVFIYNEDTLTNINLKHKTADLLCPFIDINYKGDVSDGWNHWPNVIHRIGTPWVRSLVCASRLSKNILELIGLYVRDRHLMFIEALFPSLAYQWGHKIEHPDEMQGTIHFSQEYNKDLVEHSKIYHPYKKLGDHMFLRKKIAQKRLLSLFKDFQLNELLMQHFHDNIPTYL
jgi:hypothetical protein